MYFQVSPTWSGDKFVLLVALVVHEDELLALAVEILGVDFVDVGRLDRIAALPGAVDRRAADEVLQAALVQRLALARLHEVALDHQVGVAVELDLRPFLKSLVLIVPTSGSFRFDFLVLRLGMFTIDRLSRGSTILFARLGPRHRAARPTRMNATTSVMSRLTILAPVRSAIRDRTSAAGCGLPERRLGPRGRRAAESLAGRVSRVLVPEPYLARMRPGDPLDPLLLQVLPRKEELAAESPAGGPQFVPDPLHEAGTSARPVFWESIKAGS